MVGGEGIACVDASERAGLHTIFATGASTTGSACDGLNCAMYCFARSFLSSAVIVAIGL